MTVILRVNVKKLEPSLVPSSPLPNKIGINFSIMILEAAKGSFGATCRYERLGHLPKNVLFLYFCFSGDKIMHKRLIGADRAPSKV